MNQSLSRLRTTGERGAATFLIILTILIVLFAGAFAVDLSATTSRGQDLQNAADSAALAGVQAYRESIATRETELLPQPPANATDEAVAKAAVDAMLAQNGVTGVVANVTFPDAVNNTEIRVELVDSNGGGQLLSGFTGVGGTVERNATARFERCTKSCVESVEIPEPFRDINTEGDGDGYKPIAVGDRMFSINHNSGGPRGTRQITCVDRFDGEQCWDTPGRQMYPGVNVGDWVPDSTPEMPHAAVWNDIIYWVSSTQGGTYLFCFNAQGSRNEETGVYEGVDTPCATPYRLNTNERALLNQVDNDYRVQHRGGGAFEWGGQIFAFTDDHRIHCIEPGLPLTPCETYGAAGLETQLGQLNFPPNLPFDGNNGSSIDRIIDVDAKKVYATIHITNLAGIDFQNANFPQAIDNPTCGSSLANPLGDTVVIKSASNGRYLAASGSSARYTRSDGNHITARWYVEDAGAGRVFLRNAGNDGNLYTRTSYSATYAGTSRADTTATTNLLTDTDLDAERWNLELAGANSAGPILKIGRAEVRTFPESGFPKTGYVGLYGSSEQVVNADGHWGNPDWADGSKLDWEFWPYECAIPDYAPHPTPNTTVTGESLYKTGTYVHCWDLASAVTCGGFNAARIHVDSDSFSGRLFFHRTQRTPGLVDEEIQGVCSTGFTGRWRWMDMSSFTDLVCINNETGVPNNLEASMGSFKTALTATNDDEFGWGTWGDPHWNDHTNRVFYPTNRQDSRVLCWDFDTGWCGQVQGQSAFGYIQDYGFHSVGNCIFGLGHNAYWWAFSASDITEPCSGSSRTTTISPCSCAGSDLKWGVMKFDISTELFDAFWVTIRDEEGNQVYPKLPDDPNEPIVPAHSVLALDGDTIDLNFVPVVDALQKLTVHVVVEAKLGQDPWAFGSQAFAIELERAPRLTD